ncbi:MAG: hypothetical protein IPN89_10120 [Saprospiraceae bacterium]|nr:hypothetical protein [Saprospiraceae bacterium]
MRIESLHIKFPQKKFTSRIYLRMALLSALFTAGFTNMVVAQCNFAQLLHLAQLQHPTVGCTVASITTCVYFSENSSVTGLTIGQMYKIVNSWSTIVTDGFGVYTSNVVTAPLA